MLQTTQRVVYPLEHTIDQVARLFYSDHCLSNYLLDFSKLRLKFCHQEPREFYEGNCQSLLNEPSLHCHCFVHSGSHLQKLQELFRVAGQFLFIVELYFSCQVWKSTFRSQISIFYP